MHGYVHNTNATLSILPEMYTQYFLELLCLCARGEDFMQEIYFLMFRPKRYHPVLAVKQLGEDGEGVIFNCYEIDLCGYTLYSSAATSIN